MDCLASPQALDLRGHRFASTKEYSLTPWIQGLDCAAPPRVKKTKDTNEGFKKIVLRRRGILRESMTHWFRSQRGSYPWMSFGSHVLP